MIGCSGFTVEEYSPRSTRRARRKEYLAAKNAKGGKNSEVSSVGATPCGCPPQKADFNAMRTTLTGTGIQILRVLRALRGEPKLWDRVTLSTRKPEIPNF